MLLGEKRPPCSHPRPAVAWLLGYVCPDCGMDRPSPWRRDDYLYHKDSQ